MSFELTLSTGHGYALFATFLTVPLNIYGGVAVGKARKTYNVPYPSAYAEKGHKHEKIFNCIQRAHQNFLENLPVHYFLSLSSSIYRPELASIFILIRSAGFLAYMIGYGTGDPKKRLRGAFGYIGLLGMLGLTLETIFRLIFSS